MSINLKLCNFYTEKCRFSVMVGEINFGFGVQKADKGMYPLSAPNHIISRIPRNNLKLKDHAKNILRPAFVRDGDVQFSWSVVSL